MKVIKFIKSEPVLSIAAVLALLSVAAVPPDRAYIDYCNFEVLGILFCLMLIVAGIKSAGLFEKITSLMVSRIKGEKAMIAVLTLICFVLSAVVTNDVALITFVPFTVALLGSQGAGTLIRAVTLETVAANLGSLITPIGNPQNLYLYTTYNMTISQFFGITLPLGGICIALIVLLLLFGSNKPVKYTPDSADTRVNRVGMGIFGALFVLCMFSVVKVIPWYISAVVVAVSVGIYNRRLFAEADYILLVTFVCFFVFVGNLARIDSVYAFVSEQIRGRELVGSALVSQVISNVPAAAMLSAFTDNARSLVLGTNIGGLGTLIASMASLISYRFICRSGTVKTGKYLGYFTVVNVALLAVLLVIYSV